MSLTHTRWITLLLFATLISLASGCAVPQPRGAGEYRRVKEPKTGAIYHLYLPVDYVKNDGKHPYYPERRKWPLVMTFHGMKPYDNARPQEREWEKEADNYGFVVCAPELKTSDSFMEYPLTKEWSYVREDRKNVIAIMDHVFATTKADANHVLSTSWSCGGYLAHYFPNRYPHRFSCIATRLSNFSAKLLTEETVPQYKDSVSVGVFIGDGDLPACKTESKEAVAWYQARGFKNVEGRMIDNMGHRRIPQTAASFFAKQMGLKPLHPQDAQKTIRKVTMTNYTPPTTLIARMSPGGLGSTVVASANSGDDALPDRDIRNSRLPENDRRVANSETSRLNSRSTPNRRNVRVSTEPPPRPANQQTRAPRSFDLSRSDTNRRTTPNRPASASNATRLANNTPIRRTATPQRPTSTTNRQTNSSPPVTRRSSRPQTAPPTTPRTAPDTRTKPRTVNNADRPRIRRDNDSRLANRLPTPRRTTTPRNTTPRRSQPRTTQEPRTSRARNVDINITGPTVGPAPYFLTYSVALPTDVTEGADFLWKDNGVWMDDRSTGVKVIETPGVHRITVLMISKNNVEYRGSATIRVMAEDRTASYGN